MRSVQLRHLETNCPAGFIMEGEHHENVNFYLFAISSTLLLHNLLRASCSLNFMNYCFIITGILCFVLLPFEAALTSCPNGILFYLLSF